MFEGVLRFSQLAQFEATLDAVKLFVVAIDLAIDVADICLD
ncbi:hypothetical protein [Georhizobium profundi]|nr:hypothetical protein [Georhizobium profundi]